MGDNFLDDPGQIRVHTDWIIAMDAGDEVRVKKETQLFSRSAEVPNVSDSRAVRLQIAVPLPYT
jgi:hypothetical protein